MSPAERVELERRAVAAAGKMAREQIRKCGDGPVALAARRLAVEDEVLRASPQPRSTADS